MPQDYPIQHINQYVALPELAIPVVPNDDGLGRRYRVLAVDFYIALKSDCNECGIDAFEIPGNPRFEHVARTLTGNGRPGGRRRECYSGAS